VLCTSQVIYATNVKDSDLAAGNRMTEAVFKVAESEGSAAVVVSAQVILQRAWSIFHICRFLFFRIGTG
jgi:ribosome-binding ATPase YchF (GTP1/OBG family)